MGMAVARLACLRKSVSTTKTATGGLFPHFVASLAATFCYSGDDVFIVAEIPSIILTAEKKGYSVISD